MRSSWAVGLAIAFGLGISAQEGAAFDLKEFGKGVWQDLERGVTETLEKARGEGDADPGTEPAPPTATTDKSQPPAAPSQTEPATSTARNDHALVRELQRRLNERHYDAGNADGLYGSRTANAIRAYQRAAGRPVDGEPSYALLQALQGGPVAPAAPTAPVAAAAATGLGAEVLAPAGLRMGMAVADAKAELRRLGYAPGRAAGCRFERAGPNGKGRIEVVLKIARFDTAGAAAPQNPLQRQQQQYEMERTCAADGAVVTGLTYKEMVDRAARSVAPMPEIEGLVQRLGRYDTCSFLQPHEARWCVWRAPAGDPKIKTLTVTISRAWGRQLEIEGELLEIQPVLPERAQLADVMTQEALAICQNYDAGLGGGADLVRILKDCRCIADKVGKGYARGQISKVDVHAIDRYSDGCPGDRQQLRTYFEERCLDAFANPANPDAKAWALGGGCACAGEKGVEAYLADPRASWPALGGIGSQSALAYGYGNARAPQSAGAETPSTPARVEAAGAGYTALGAVPAGIRPFEMWLQDGRPVIHERFEAWTALDRTFDYGPQGLAVARFINLLLLAGEPGLLETAPDAVRVLAGDNLADAERARLMKGCQPGQAARYCAWAGRDEFETRAAADEFRTRFAPLLPDLAAALPREIVYVERAQLGTYDPARGGFPIKITSQRTYGAGLSNLFQITNDSLLGTSIKGVREAPKEDPSFWPVAEAGAPALVERLTSTRSGDQVFRFVQLAWTYRIERFDRSQTSDMADQRLMVVKATAVRLFADARLTDLVAELPLPGGAEAVADAASAPAQEPPAAAAAAPIPVKPLEIETVDGRPVIELERTRTSADNVRYFNLLLLGQQPGLVNDPASALILAQDHLVGLAAPERRAWAGTTEFEQARSQAAFKERGARQVLGLALGLPQEIVIRRRAMLEPYDFERERFAIQEGGLLDVGGQRPPDGGLLQRLSYDSILPKPIGLHWTNGVIPDAWQIPVAQAQAAVAKLQPASGGRRSVYLAAVVRLNRMTSDGQGNPVFEGELLEVGLYVDRELTDRVAPLPMAPLTGG